MTEALQLWNANRTGPLVWLGRLDQIAWVRLPNNSPIFQRFADPSSGSNSAHYELALGVRCPALQICSTANVIEGKCDIYHGWRISSQSTVP